MIWTTGRMESLLVHRRQGVSRSGAGSHGIFAVPFEQQEFDEKTGLFRGPGWSDGVAGYPDAYADAGGSSSILDWPKHHPDKVSKPGYGIPMEALSTNCIYYNAYVTAEKMKAALKPAPSTFSNLGWRSKGGKSEEGHQ